MLGTFEYQASDKDGQISRGQVRAQSTQDAFDEIKKLGLIPIKISPLANREDFNFKDAIKKLQEEKRRTSAVRWHLGVFSAAILLIILFLAINVFLPDSQLKNLALYACFVGIVFLTGLYMIKS